MEEVLVKDGVEEGFGGGRGRVLVLDPGVVACARDDQLLCAVERPATSGNILSLSPL